MVPIDSPRTLESSGDVPCSPWGKRQAGARCPGDFELGRISMKAGRIGADRVVVLAAAVSLATACGAAPETSTGTPAAAPTGDFSYEPFASALREHVDIHDMVDYAGLETNRGDLDAFVVSLATVDPAVYEGWNTDEKIAFWINAYNALTLRAIVDHYPIESSVLRSVVYPENSIRQIPGVWKKLRFRVMGDERTLDEIEHETLRVEFDEPRIHMALVCAAKGCPPLRWEPYTGEKLDGQLEDQIVRFLGHREKFRLDREAGRVGLSPIFKWFGDDFVSVYGPDRGFEGREPGQRAVLHFIALHLEGPDKEFLEQGDYEIDYLDYDWSLNEATPSSEASS
jgi:hypothetical protein